MAVSMLVYHRPSTHSSLPQVLHACFLAACLKTPSFLSSYSCWNPRPALPFCLLCGHPAALMCLWLFALRRPNSALASQSFLFALARSLSLASSLARTLAISESLASSSARVTASSVARLTMVSEASSAARLAMLSEDSL